MRKVSAGIAWAILGATVLFSACANLPWGAPPANSDRVEITEDFKNGDTRLECQLRCAFAWGLKRDRVKALYDAKAWRDVALEVLRIGYGDDLAYFYLGKAAEGLGYHRGAETYFRLSRAAPLKCNDIYGYCYGVVLPRDASPSSGPLVAKKTAESSRQYAEAPNSRGYDSSSPSTAPPDLGAQPQRQSGASTEAVKAKPPASAPVERQRLTNSSAAETEKRSNTAAPKKSPAEKPVQQAEANNPRVAAKTEAPTPAAAEKKIAEAEFKPTTSITFEDISEKFGPHSRLTEAQKRDEWKNYRGRCVEWNGELSYVGDSFIRGLTLGFKQSPQTLTYDVLVSAPDDVRDAALRMKKGARYAYRATLKNYGGPILPISVEWGCRAEPRITQHVKTD